MVRAEERLEIRVETITSAVLSIAEKHLGEFRIRNGQVVTKICPFCQGGDNGDENTFAVGLYNGAYSCLRGGCNKTGNLRDLCNHFGVMHDDLTYNPKPIGVNKKKIYEKPDASKYTVINEEGVTYLGVRKISEQTISDFNLLSDDQGNIVFPFFREGELVFVKYRKPYKDKSGPKEWQDKNTEPILFGMDMASFHKPLIITEGEIDALSLYEAGCANVVSVPSGCNNMEWITNCWDWLEKFSQIILFGDSDEPGIEMCNTLMKRLGEDRCMMPKEYPEFILNGELKGRPCKDANEILYCYGPEVLKSIVDSCEPAPIKGVLNLASVPFIDPSTIPRIFTRVPALDNAIGGLGEGGVTVFTGK